MLQSDDTIAAIATAVMPQQGSIGVVRLSGRKSLAIARSLFDSPGKQDWKSHRILYGYVRQPQTQQLIDEALLLLMLAPRSYTREDVVEFHCHGGIISVQQVLQLCLEAGARLAEPGEFTLRAFLNGRIDLTQAESVAEIVGAQSHTASRIALAGLEGKLAQPIQGLRQRCLNILAEVEARIDFEDDLPPLDEAAVKGELNQVLVQVEQIISTAESGELVRSGIRIAIVGRPNVGKSSLLNAWSRCDRAIVTDLPGTTRDLVESQLVVQGIPVIVVDTAGIRETEDTVEQIGVARSRQAAQQADLVVLVIDASQSWTDQDQQIYQQVKHRPLILAINKTDLQPKTITNYPKTIDYTVTTAAAKLQGIDQLEQTILKAMGADHFSAANLDWAINQRQAAALTQAKVALQQVQTTIAEGLPLDFWTIDLRDAIRALGEITGDDVTESVLERIFSRFCIGK